MSLMLSAYAGAATLAAPALRAMLAWRLRRGREIAARLPERWGADPTPRPPGRLVWLHASSVGEAVSVLPVLAALADAGVEALITTGTVTSAGLLAQRLPALAAGGSGAPPVRAARRAGLGGALPRPLAARRGGLRGKRDLAQPDRRLPPPRRADDAGERPAVRRAARPAGAVRPGSPPSCSAPSPARSRSPKPTPPASARSAPGW